jgi:putative PEP-CTERM system TPR-repeat lipoprotein
MLRNNILVIVCVLSLISCSGKSKDELFYEGVKLINTNNPLGAIVLLKNALEKDPNFFEARHQLAKAYMSAGKFEQAGQEFQKLMRMDPSYSEFQLELARAYLYAHKTNDALREVNLYIETHQTNPEALEIRGYAYTANGNLAAGEADLLRTLRIEPSRASAKLGLAAIYEQRGKTADAEALLNEVIRSDEKNIKAYYMLAGLQTSMSKREQALQTYQNILQISPTEIDAFYRTGLIYVDSKEYEKANQTADELIAKFPKAPSGTLLKGIIAIYKNDFNGSEAALRQSIALRPTIGAFYFLGMAYYQQGQDELALSQFQRVLDNQPSNIQSRLFLALIHLRKKRPDNAISELKLILQDHPDHAIAHNLLGSAYLQSGMTDEGMKELNKALELDPKLAEAHLKKGMLELSSGNFKEAEMELRIAVNVAPEVINTRLLLSSYYLKQQDYPRAFSTLNDGLSGKKSDALLYNSMAAILIMQKKTCEALALLLKAKEVDPDFYDAYFNSALFYVVMDENEKALNEYQAVLKRDTRNVRAMVSIAMLMEIQGKQSESASYFSRAEETKEAAAYLAHSYYYVRKHDTQNALVVLDNLLKQQPTSAAALELKGKILFGAHRYKDAVAVFNHLETAAPGKGLPGLIDSYIAMQDYKTALTRIQNKLALNPEEMWLRGQMARIYVLMGDESKAVDSANSIIGPWRYSAAGYMVLASVYDQLNKSDSAIEALKKGIQTDGKNIEARLALGNLYAKKNDYPSAIDMYRSISKMRPDAVQALFAEAIVYDKMGKKNEAVKEYQHILEKAGDYLPAMNNLAFLYLQGLGGKEKALELALRAYRAAPETPQVMDTLGYALVENNRPKEAFELLRNANMILPDDPSVLYHLALVYKESGDTGHAREFASRALKSTNFPEAKEVQLLLDSLNRTNIGLNSR